jgi:hypothetical protein
VFVKGYRYRVGGPRSHSGWHGFVLVRKPYEHAAVLRPRSDPEEILELHWYRSEADYERARGRPAAEVHGMELDEPFPGVVVLPGTQVEEIEFDDAPGIAALAFPYGPPPRYLDAEQTARLRALLRALIDRIAPALPEGFSLTFTADSLLLHRDLERLDEIGLEWAVDVEEEVLASKVCAALDRLQDTIAEETTDPWPGRGSLPGAGAEVRDGALHLWYGDAGEPVLAFEPITLADLEAG